MVMGFGWVLLAITSISAGALSQYPVYTKWSEASRYQQVIFTVPTSNASLPQHRFVADSIDTLAIAAGQYPFTQEAEAFRQFRDNYVSYWTVYNLMMTVNLLWR